MALALLLFVTVVLVLFVIFNTQTVDISLVFTDVRAPLVLALVIAAGAWARCSSRLAPAPVLPRPPAAPQPLSHSRPACGSPLGACHQRVHLLVATRR